MKARMYLKRWVESKGALHCGRLDGLWWYQVGRGQLRETLE